MHFFRDYILQSPLFTRYFPSQIHCKFSNIPLVSISLSWFNSTEVLPVYMLYLIISSALLNIYVSSTFLCHFLCQIISTIVLQDVKDNLVV